MIESAVLKQWKRLLHSEEKSFDIDAERFIKVRFSNCPQWN